MYDYKLYEGDKQNPDYFNVSDCERYLSKKI